VELLFAIEEAEPGLHLQRLYDRVAARFGFDAARVRVSRRKLTGGHIEYGPPHRITISAHLSLAEQRDTLLHEAAHAWAWRLKGPREGHGRLFRRLAGTLGVRPGGAPETRALAAFRESRARHVYRCDGCARLFRRFRPFRGARECLACHRAGRPARLRRVRNEPA
jgi:predicted SprT family Zn-dependent metalloprotease